MSDWHSDNGWTIGKDLRWVDTEGELRYVIHNHTLLAALGLKKLPVEAFGPARVGDTFVLIHSREAAAQANPNATRPHRLVAKCNSCGRWIPAGKFGQHLGLNKVNHSKKDRKPIFAKPCSLVRGEGD